MIESAAVYLKNLEISLERDLSATGNSLQEKLSSIRANIPDDLADKIEMVAAFSDRLNSEDSADWANMIFRCGQVAQQLEDLRRERAADDVMSAHPAGAAPTQMESADLDAVARFIAARDRLMRVVADFTLKALLLIVTLLVAGLALGVI